ncbi:MAG: class I SAM-dependent methyltransferase [Planctomycetota bacterium]|nr:MAG: class I SAM-dependent methyltransferase [Planctomycetota bacterium]
MSTPSPLPTRPPMDPRKYARYNSREGADEYAHKFEKHLHERLNNWNEQRLLRSILHELLPARATAPVLDLPCGCGRLYPLLREVADRVVESDWGTGMLENARAAERDDPALGYVRATALAIPFRDRAFELVLSVRLSHHLREREDRLAHIRELCRVSDRWVVFTFFDERSLKARLRAWRHKLTGKRLKSTLRLEEVERAADEAGFELVRATPLARLFSGHRYTVLRRRDER